jgi:hypothetical protein
MASGKGNSSAPFKKGAPGKSTTSVGATKGGKAQPKPNAKAGTKTNTVGAKRSSGRKGY